MKKIITIIIVFIAVNVFSQNCDTYFIYDILQQGFVEFTDSSSNSDTNQVASSWYWDFGDGSSSTEQNPSHNYNDLTQNYYVCLTTVFSDSCSSTFCDSVYFVEPCNMYLTYTKTDVSTYGGNDGSIDITVHNINTYVNYFWSNGETTEDISNLIAGEYAVSVIDSLGCSTDATITIVEPQLILSLSGNIYAKTALLPEGVAVLIKKELADYTAIAYTQITNGYYIFNNLDTAEYLVYAVPYFGVDVNYFPIYFPTYSGDNINYENSQTVYVDSIHVKDINLEYNEEINHGQGYISGTLVYDYGSNFETAIFNQNWFGGTKTSYEGIAQNTAIFLLNSSGNAIKYSLSDSNGKFEIKDIPYGEYTVYTEKAGRTTQVFNVNLTSENDSSINNLIHIQQGNVIEVKNIIDDNITVYPNPFTNYITINAEQINYIEIINISGKVINLGGNITKNTENYTINTSDLEEGMYFLRATNQSGNMITKKIIKILN